MKKTRIYKLLSIALALVLLVSCYPYSRGPIGDGGPDIMSSEISIADSDASTSESNKSDSPDKNSSKGETDTDRKPTIVRPTSSKETEKDETSSKPDGTLSTVPGTYYLIAYNANGGSGNMKSTKAVFGEDVRLSENTFTWDGHEFLGWNLMRNIDDKWLYYNSSNAKLNWHSEGYQPEFWLKRLYNDCDIVSFEESDVGTLVTLYAKWRECCQIVYDANGGSGEMKETLVYDQPNAEFSKSTFTKQGYTFSGWHAYSATFDQWAYSNLSGGIVWESEETHSLGYKKHVFADRDKISIIGDMTCSKIILYAVWTKN